MSSETSIRVENLSKCYQIYARPSDRLKQSTFPRLQRLLSRPTTRYYQEHWALQDVSFEIKKGETVGVIGRNGSGKSTLLQMICGTLNPTSGTIETRGRIAALLELGSGFNPEFTGHENIYMNAAVLGLSKEETDACFNDIVDFANIGDFLNQPVKTYSSGMMLRLAFAVQAQTSPDILIVDEALAVGDARFQAKCFDRLKKLKEEGTSILLVTHASEQIVTHCQVAMLLDSGKVVESGSPRDVVNSYMDLLFGKARAKNSQPSPLQSESDTTNLQQSDTPLSHTEDLFATRDGYNSSEYRWGDGSASILDFHLSDRDGKRTSIVESGQDIELTIAIRFHVQISNPLFGITFKTKEGITVYGANSETLRDRSLVRLGDAKTSATVTTKFCCRLAPGDYFISLGLVSKQHDNVVPHDRRYDSIHLQVRPDNAFFGLVNLELQMDAKANTP